MKEYSQTVQDRCGAAGAAITLNPPPGDGWTLHSWQMDPGQSITLVIVWERELRALAHATPVVDKIVEEPLK